jgi:hypothetical protein
MTELLGRAMHVKLQFTRQRLHWRMSLNLEELEIEAMPSRAELAAGRMDAKDELCSNPEVEKAWITEALRRRDDVRAGKSQTIPADTVFAEARERLRR